MKKILLFILLLLNLQVTIDKGSLNLGFGSMMAQSMLEETLQEVVVTGNPYTTCSLCQTPVLKKDLEWHHKTDCPMYTVVCESCGQSYIRGEGHNCPDESICELCQEPSSLCTCVGCNCKGHGNSDSSGNDDADIGVGAGHSGGTGQSSSGFKTNISVRDLRFKTGVRLVSYMGLPQKLHPQTRKMECVLRAYAFMAQLRGYDYDVVCDAMDRIAKAKDIDLEVDGIDPGELSTFFQNYCQIGTDDNNPSNVSSYIDKGIPVALVTCATPYHMVTVIGYDRDHYYTAAGDVNGDVTIYAKSQLICSDYFYVFNSTNIPFK